jgi:hypothetical protein
VALALGLGPLPLSKLTVEEPPQALNISKAGQHRFHDRVLNGLGFMGAFPLCKRTTWATVDQVCS